MKQTLLLVVLLFTAASAPCQTNTGLVPGDPTYQQQFDSESGNHSCMTSHRSSHRLRPAVEVRVRRSAGDTIQRSSLALQRKGHSWSRPSNAL